MALTCDISKIRRSGRDRDDLDTVVVTADAEPSLIIRRPVAYIQVTPIPTCVVSPGANELSRPEFCRGRVR
jgi:hypothetical protein